MLYRIALVCFTGLLLGADKKPITGQGGNDRMSLQAIAYITKDEVKQALGADPGASIVVLEVSVSPRGGKPVAISKDDFLLRSYKDGQKSQPFAPSQIAGKGGLQLSESGGGGAIMGDRGGPIWGGIGGGPPRRMGGDGGGIGNAAGPAGTPDAAMQNSDKEKENPLLAVLKQKGLPEKETTEPVKGLLYFPLDGKHKAKDLALTYTGPAGKITLEFHQ